MRLLRYIAFSLFIVAAGVRTSAAEEEKPPTVAEQYRALLKEFHGASYSYFQSTNDAQRQAIVARVDNATTKCLELVEKNLRDPIALEALTQVVTEEYWLNTHTSHPGWGKESRQARAIALLLRDHLESDKLAETCKRVHFGFRQECETFLRTVLEKNPHREIQGVACLRLAQFLANRLERLNLLADQPELAKRYDALFGKDYMDALKRQDRARVIREVEALYERTIEKYSDVQVPQYNNTAGNQAEIELFEIRYLALGKEAPDIEGEDQDGKQFKLSDYRGRVVLLYFWSEF
ncbi:MAG: peroxiredoxin family protein [Verrucomicrobia subdivision 3 bacterium]|nr:peroxiredoxin family protein [Limisphaerales bacterium]